jgi:hypothetical protein
VAFQFEKASCVVVGTFNMYILHPQWLLKNNILENPADTGFEINLARPGFRFRFESLTISVSPDRLAIETQDPAADCGKTIAAILEKLPHTPLFALGNNAQYRADTAEAAELSQPIRDWPRIESPMPASAVVQRTFHVGIKRAERENVNLQIAIKENSLELISNVHVDLTGSELPSVPAVAAANRFFEDRQESKILAQHFFGTTIDHATHRA